MEVIIGLILIVLAIYLLVTYVIPAAVAIGGVAAAIIAAIAVAVGLYSAVKNYIASVSDNWVYFSWYPKKPGGEPAKRSYFFGPGYTQLFETIGDAFSYNAKSGKKILDTADTIRGLSDGIWGFIRAIGSWLYIIVGYVCIYVVGSVLCAGIGLVHMAILLVFMSLIYVIFSIVWLIDRLYLLINKIRSDCPSCKERYLIPSFRCPGCGAMHKKLVPGPYGIWKHKCDCGKKLPATFLNGRSKLEAFCPCCDAPLVASDARPVVFQLIGGSKAGKTVYLSSFFHAFRRRLRANDGLEVTIADRYQPYFDELEEWYNGADCPATTRLNSQMYPLLIDSKLGIRRQFSIYDIAGEMFDGHTADSEIQQQQFHYCDGLLFLLDPFSSGELRRKRVSAGEDISDFSDMAVEDVVTNFINYLIRTGHAKANARCNIPIAVLIAKADVREVRREIGPAKINAIFKRDPEQYGTLENARDTTCRQFLNEIGFSFAVDNLETQFSNLHYFPVSAMGHSPDGKPFEPWGVTDAVDWMLPLADKELSDLITPPTALRQ